MRCVADESVDRQIVEALRAEGHDVVYIAELDPGLPDDAVLDLSRTGDAVLVTADKDFGELVFRQRRLSAGVLLLRLAGLAPETKATLVRQSVVRHAAAIPGAFAVLSPGAFRVRRQAR